MGNFRLIKITKVNFFAIKIDMSRELIPSLVMRNPKKPRGVMPRRLSMVVDVLLLSHFAQIAKSIVKTVAIDVINCFWNVTMSQKPRKLMASHALTANTYLQISAINNSNSIASLF